MVIVFPITLFVSTCTDNVTVYVVFGTFGRLSTLHEKSKEGGNSKKKEEPFK